MTPCKLSIDNGYSFFTGAGYTCDTKINLYSFILDVSSDQTGKYILLPVIRRGYPF